MNFWAYLFYKYRRGWKAVKMYLILAGPGIIVMIDQVISLSPENTLKEASAMFARYGFRALPIIDSQQKILGVVPYRDVMNLKHRFVE